MNKQLAIPSIVALTVVMVLGMMSPALASHQDMGDDTGDKKVTICHITSGHNGEKTITVSEKAVSKHLDHGDTLGACGIDDEEAEPIDDGDIGDGGEFDLAEMTGQ